MLDEVAKLTEVVVVVDEAVSSAKLCKMLGVKSVARLLASILLPVKIVPVENENKMKQIVLLLNCFNLKWALLKITKFTYCRTNHNQLLI